MVISLPFVNESAIASPAVILAIAVLLDALIGDPWGWPHPVQAMGCFIQLYVRVTQKLTQSPALLRMAGVVLGLFTVIGSGFIGWGIVAIARLVHPVFSLMVASVLLASCLAERSLRDAAKDVLTPLQTHDLDTARSRLQRYVGRDTDALSPEEIYRAVFETVSENATDGVMAPLFYGIVGALTPVGSVPIALAYKAASTLDSMVGYRTEPYKHLGYFSAKMEDGLTWLPCRLTVLTLGLLSGRPRKVWRICRRDAPQDPSPNAGWSECVYAAALKVQVGGSNTYGGRVIHKPKLGDRIHPITAGTVNSALALTRRAVLIWLGLGILLIFAVTYSR
ncbi:MAG: adenosylcobinamide-phosphate synthase CbiB [Leptolyngbyaceae bacterium]|nr:adenosylcobinamide-phosphate synthase CbiB [Leptolyngbyaceae bacterium]